MYFNSEELVYGVTVTMQLKYGIISYSQEFASVKYNNGSVWTTNVRPFTYHNTTYWLGGGGISSGSTSNQTVSFALKNVGRGSWGNAYTEALDKYFNS